MHGTRRRKSPRSSPNRPPLLLLCAEADDKISSSSTSAPAETVACLAIRFCVGGCRTDHQTTAAEGGASRWQLRWSSWCPRGGARHRPAGQPAVRDHPGRGELAVVGGPVTRQPDRSYCGWDGRLAWPAYSSGSMRRKGTMSLMTWSLLSPAGRKSHRSEGCHRSALWQVRPSVRDRIGATTGPRSPTATA